MAALAYLLPPLSGLVAYFSRGDARLRFHGLQSVVLGVAWPAALYLASALSPDATIFALLLGTGAWLVLLFGAALGKDPRLPGGRFLQSAAAEDPRADGD